MSETEGNFKLFAAT